jgi:uncharacterized protein (TIGR03067 family)
MPLGIASVAQESSPDSLAADMKAIQGAWRGWVVEGKGEQPNQGFVHLEVIIKNDTMTAQRLDRQKDAALGEGTFKLALADKHKTIDATRTSTPGKGQVNIGIYSLEGDTLKWCVGAPNKDRPEDFVSRRGQFLLILKRQPASGK